MRQFKLNARARLAHPYESAWSITQKLGLWNAVESADIVKYLPPLGTVAIGPTQLAAATDYVQKRTGLSMPIGEALWLNGYLPPFALGDQLRMRFIREDLAWCPLCLQSGFHSPVHQLAWMEQCPWHAVPLHYCCAGCGNPVAWSEASARAQVNQFLCPHCRGALHGGATIRIAGQTPQGAAAQIGAYLAWARAQAHHWTGPAVRRAVAHYRQDRNGAQPGDVVLAALSRSSNQPLPDGFFAQAYRLKTLAVIGPNVQAIDQLIEQFGLFALVEAWLVWREQPDGSNPSTYYIERLIERAFRFQNGKRELPAILRRTPDMAPRLAGMIGVMFRPDCRLSSAFEWVRLHFLEHGNLGRDRIEVYSATEIALVAEAKGLIASAFVNPDRRPDSSYRRRTGVAHVFNAQMQIAPDLLQVLRAAMAMRVWYVVRDALNQSDGATLQEWLPRATHDPFVVVNTEATAGQRSTLRAVFAKKKSSNARPCRATAKCRQCPFR